MRDDPDFDLDAALGGLARAVARGAPVPGAALRARVLHDAARAMAERRGPALTLVPQRPRASARPGWRPRGGWVAQAAVAMAACLAVGFTIGYAMDGGMIDVESLTTPGPMAAVGLGDALFAVDEAI